MTPLLRAALAALLALILVGCQSTGTAGSRLQPILESGEIRVGLSGTQPPLNMKGSNDEIVGFEVDIVRALAESMDLELRFVMRPFAELLPALSAGEVDLVISGLTMTPERNARVAFAGPYLISGKSVLAKEGRVESVETAELLDDPGRRWAVLAGSTSERFVRERLPRSKRIATQNYGDAVELVTQGRVDGLVADFPVCMWAASQNPDARLTAMHTPFTVEPLGIALPPDDPLLTNLVQNHLTTLRETGLLSRFKARWLSGDVIDDGGY